MVTRIKDLMDAQDNGTLTNLFGESNTPNNKFKRMCTNAAMRQINELNLTLKMALKLGLFDNMTEEQGMSYINELNSNLFMCIMKMKKDINN